MYIAFKWLVTLTLMMWLVMCFLDFYIKRNIKQLKYTGIDKSPAERFQNETVKSMLKLTPNAAKPFVKEDTIYLYYEKKYDNKAGLKMLLVLAGALGVVVYFKSQDSITFKRFPAVHLIVCWALQYLKITAIKSSIAIGLYLRILWEKIELILYRLRYIMTDLRSRPAKHNKIHTILLQKLKQMGEERKNLGQLLITAIRENKHIRMRYELETLTKNRLMQHIEDTQKQIKENRSRYLSFQQLYLVTHQENNYLRARLVKLRQERDETAKNLMGLINEVYLSSNNDLKKYCTRFLVKTKDNLLNSDVCAEIKEFLENSRKPSYITLVPNDIKRDRIRTSSSIMSITQLGNLDETNCISSAPDAPKLIGLPGEYVWTVKDKNGIIEKLYEYDFEANLDNGDTIRRIRQYSVYFDKDCLLDFSKFQRGAEITDRPSTSARSNGFNNSLGYHNIVTGSVAFQNFLRNNKSLVLSKSHYASSVK